MKLPRTHAELDALAAAHEISFPDDIGVEEKQRLLTDAGVADQAEAVAFRLAVDELDGEPLNYLELGAGGGLIRLAPGEQLLTTERQVIDALDAHPLVARTEEA